MYGISHDPTCTCTCTCTYTLTAASLWIPQWKHDHESVKLSLECRDKLLWGSKGMILYINPSTFGTFFIQVDVPFETILVLNGEVHVTVQC